MQHPAWCFWRLEYLDNNSIDQITILSNVISRGSKKLHQFDVIDNSFGRSRYFRQNNGYTSHYQRTGRIIDPTECTIPKVNWFQWWKIYENQFVSLCKKYSRKQWTWNSGLIQYPRIWIVDLEDLIIQIFNISSIPRIANEL